MAVAPYPHIKMGVRDESIYVGLDTEILPLDKPLYMMRTQKGPIGKPVWCSTYTIACQIFGTETFNKRNKLYWSEASYFLLKTLVSNGAFIMRVADDSAKISSVYVECGIKKSDVPQWQRNPVSGVFMLDDEGNKIKINKSGTPCEKLTSGATEKVYSQTTDSVAVAGKTYYWRDYLSYIYTPYMGTTAEDNMIAWYGDTDTATEDKTYTAATLTDEIIWKNHLYTKAAANVYEKVTIGTDSTPDAYTTYYTKSGEGAEAVYTAAESLTAFVSGTDYYVKTVSQGQYIPVADKSSLSTTETYYTLKFTTFIPMLFNKGDVLSLDNGTVADVGIWYTRKPNVKAGHTHKALVNSQAGSTLSGVTDFPAGSKILTDGTLLKKNTDATYSYVGNFGSLYEYVKELTAAAGDYESQATVSGYKLCWRAKVRGVGDDREFDSAMPASDTDGGYTWYPMMAFETEHKGKWGDAFGFRFYYDKTQNTIAAITTSGAVKYSLAPVELKADATTPTAIVDAYGDSTVVGTIRDGVVDPTTDLEITLKKLVPGKYSGSRELPCNIALMPENFNIIGKLLLQAEIDARDEVAAIYGDTKLFDLDDNYQPKVVTFVDDILGNVDGTSTSEDIETLGDEAGHVANCVSCYAADRTPYFASCVIGKYDEAEEKLNSVTGAIDMNDDSVIYLRGGNDGDISDYHVESMIRESIDACVAQTHEYLVDYLRCPYNNIIDTGVSIKTKKSYLDFMGVRDNLTVFLTPQQLWKNEDGSTPVRLSYYEDEQVGAMLRSYGLLMREDVENCTEANRCVIFLGSGVNSDHDYANNGLCASTLWIALKNAEYLNGTAIRQEPVERPNSEIKCYDGGMTYTAASEETRSRCWNAGLNYAQYCEQTVIHYASVRSIYRYDTSVLCDLGTVRAVTFCKDIIRKEWAIWAGSKRKAEDLNGRITKALNEKLQAMLNNKYTFSVKVYQTDEDKKYGYVRHVDLELESPAQNRVWLATIICKREGFDPNAED